MHERLKSSRIPYASRSNCPKPKPMANVVGCIFSKFKRMFPSQIWVGGGDEFRGCCCCLLRIQSYLFSVDIIWRSLTILAHIIVHTQLYVHCTYTQTIPYSQSYTIYRSVGNVTTHHQPSTKRILYTHGKHHIHTFQSFFIGRRRRHRRCCMSLCVCDSIVDVSNIERILPQHLRRERAHGFTFFFLFCYSCWYTLPFPCRAARSNIYETFFHIHQLSVDNCACLIAPYDTHTQTHFLSISFKKYKGECNSIILI